MILHDADGGEGGEYLLEIRYCRGEEGSSSYEVQVNEKTPVPAVFPETGAFSANNMEVLRVPVILEAGRTNKIVLRKTEKKDRGIFVDALTVLMPEVR